MYDDSLEFNDNHVIPEAPAVRRGGQFIIRCPLCKRKHYHGAGLDGLAYGHRSSHCLEKRPDDRGYILVPAPVKPR
jgi:hypothetical protein